MVRALGLVLLWLGLLGCATAHRPAQLISGEGPVYPESARVQQIEGYVTVVYDLTVAGDVVNLRIVDAEPAGVFEAAALRAVQGWQFLPKRLNGKAVEVLAQRSTLTFKWDGAANQDDEQSRKDSAD